MMRRRVCGRRWGWLLAQALAWLLLADTRPLAAAEGASLPVAAPVEPTGGAMKTAAPTLPVLRPELRRYFAQEQRGGIVLMAMGAPAVAVGAGLLVDTPDLWRGMAYPLLILGGVEFVGGLVFAARTPDQVRKLEHGLSTQPRLSLTTELARMRRVNRQFLLLEIVESLVLTGGIALSAAGGAAKSSLLTGVGLGLSIESAGLLVFDVIAAARAHRYTDSLQREASALDVGAVNQGLPPDSQRR